MVSAIDLQQLVVDLLVPPAALDRIGNLTADTLHFNVYS